MTSREAAPLIAAALNTPGGVIGDDVAATIADWFKTPYERDLPLVALACGRTFDAVALLDRVDELLRKPDTEDMRSLTALRAWALARVPHVVVTEYHVDADTWEKLGRGEIDTHDDVPDGVEPADVDVTVFAHMADDLADWVNPGEPGYPEVPEESGYDFDPDDRSVLVPATVVEAASAALDGTHTGFWAQSYGGDPFGTGLYWEYVGTFDELGAGKPYASRYIHPHTGEVEIRVARLVGLTPEQEAEVYAAWRKA